MMKLGMQAGLGPGHIVLDVDPAPSPIKGAAPSPFWRGERGPHVTQSRLGRGLVPYQVTS